MPLLCCPKTRVANEVLVITSCSKQEEGGNGRKNQRRQMFCPWRRWPYSKSHKARVIDQEFDWQHVRTYFPYLFIMTFFGPHVSSVCDTMTCRWNQFSEWWAMRKLLKTFPHWGWGLSWNQGGSGSRSESPHVSAVVTPRGAATESYKVKSEGSSTVLTAPR